MILSLKNSEKTLITLGNDVGYGKLFTYVKQELVPFLPEGIRHIMYMHSCNSYIPYINHFLVM